jgi:hypothetical protein
VLLVPIMYAQVHLLMARELFADGFVLFWA